EKGDEHIGTRDLVPARRLDVKDCALDHALEAAGWRWIRGAVGNKSTELVVEILLDRSAKLVAADAAGGHDLRRMLVVDERNQQVLEGRILMAALAGLPQRVVEGLFEFASKTRHLGLYSRARREAHGL